MHSRADGKANSVTSSAREALIAEALGDMATLLDRLEAVKPALETACQELTKAGEALARNAANAESRVAAVADGAAVRAVKHIARRADELVKHAREKELRAMQTTARELIKIELGDAVKRLVADTKPSYFYWWTHLATAVAASYIGYAIAMTMVGH